MMFNTQNNAHTNEVQKIISDPPKWLLRWGVSLLVALLVAAGILSNIIQYPETVDTNLEILNNSFNKPIAAETSGTIMSVLCKNNQHVIAGQTIMLIETKNQVVKVTAPLTGKLNIIGLPMVNQQVLKNELLFLLSNPKDKFYARLSIPQNSYLAIKKGQRVQLELEKYPSDQFGGLDGVIDSVAVLPANNGFFTARVIIDGRYNKNIILTNGLLGKAQIITSEATLLKRILDKKISIK